MGLCAAGEDRKTYVGTKVEIVVRDALRLERGSTLDLEIEGHHVDTKWAMNSGWQIPREAVEGLCLCIGGLAGMKLFQVGVVRCSEGHLNPGENRDGKRTLSAKGRAAMRHLVEPTAIPGNFVADMDSGIRAEVMAHPTIQGRITALFRLLPYQPIPRNAVGTVARTTGDPMRRLRADAWAGDPLGGMRILSSQYGNEIVEALGHPRMTPGHFMSVPASEIEAIPEALRKTLSAAVRGRFGLD